MGCVCDPGYSGPDCSKQVCKSNADPLYYDDQVNVRFSNFTFAIWNAANIGATAETTGTSGTANDRIALWKGNFSITFYDINGKAWSTDPIDIKATCDDITNALETLPNNVIHPNTVLCSKDKAVIGGYAPDTGVGASVTIPTNPINAGIPDGFPIALSSTYYSAQTSKYYPYVANKFTLAFPNNPGKLKQPSLNYFLDGSRPTITTGSTDAIASVVQSWVYANGFSGENFDFVPDLCQGVNVSISVLTGTTNWGVLGSMSADQVILLKRCLGDSDGNPGNNNDNHATTLDALYNWDYGQNAQSTGSPTASVASTNVVNPHLIKLLDTSIASETRLCTTTDHTFTGVDQINQAGYCSNPYTLQAGFYAVLYYDASLNSGAGQFVIMSPSYKDYPGIPSTTKFYVFTTTGYLTLSSTTTDVFTMYNPAAIAPGTSPYSGMMLDLTSMYSNVVYTYANDAGGINNIDCETMSGNTAVKACIKKGDYVMIFTADATSSATNPNPKYPNIYQVMKISKINREEVNPYYTTSADIEAMRYQIVLDMGVNAQYRKTVLTSSSDIKVRLYKFTPPTNMYNYVGECSNRGICDTTSGVCNCFGGYTSDDCSVQNALHA